MISWPCADLTGRRAVSTFSNILPARYHYVESSVFGKTGLPGSIGCLSYNTDGTRINCALRSGFYSMDSEVITRGIDKRVFSDPITSIASFNLNNQSYNLVLGDESGNVSILVS